MELSNMCLDNPFQTYWKTEQSVFLSWAKIICRIYLKKIIFAIIFNWKSLLLLRNKHYILKKTQWKPPYLFFSGRCIFKPVTNRCGHCHNSAAHLIFLGKQGPRSSKHVPLFIVEKEAQVDTLDSGAGWDRARTAPGIAHNSLYLDRCQGSLSRHCCRWSQLCTHGTARVSAAFRGAAQMVSILLRISFFWGSLQSFKAMLEDGIRLPGGYILPDMRPYCDVHRK